MLLVVTVGLLCCLCACWVECCLLLLICLLGFGFEFVSWLCLYLVLLLFGCWLLIVGCRCWVVWFVVGGLLISL